MIDIERNVINRKIEGVDMLQKITPNLWFDGNAREAVDYYVSVFPDSKIGTTSYYPEEGLLDFQKNLAGKELTIDFELSGNQFTAINAGPEFKFNESVSFSVACKDQEEIDYYWGKLSSIPEAEQCGWCKDKYGLSWQVVPKDMETLMQKPDAFASMMQMKKIVIADF
jgi:predicted 3-demethylubiquinone-9 3-methyltransferase (glyoxalase superfamily)